MRERARPDELTMYQAPVSPAWRTGTPLAPRDGADPIVHAGQIPAPDAPLRYRPNRMRPRTPHFDARPYRACIRPAPSPAAHTHTTPRTSRLDPLNQSNNRKDGR